MVAPVWGGMGHIYTALLIERDNERMRADGKEQPWKVKIGPATGTTDDARGISQCQSGGK